MKILVERENKVGGVIRLEDLLRDAGYFGTFSVQVIDDSGVGEESDDIHDGTLVHEYSVEVLSAFLK